MKKTNILSLILAILLCFSFVACTPTIKDEADDSTADTTVSQTDETADTDGESDAETVDESDEEKTELSVAMLAGPTGMGAAYLMEQSSLEQTKNRYNFTISAAPTEITAGLINGSYDIAAVPTNLAATLYQKTKGDVQVLACNTLGVLYLLEAGDTIHSISDLAGKTIYATGQGATPEYILRYLLTANGINPDTDVTIEFYAEHAELATLLKEGSVAIGLLPEPNVMVVRQGNANVRIALNLTEEWEKADCDGALIMGCVVVNTTFAAEHPEAVAAFLAEYKASIDYANAHVAETAQLIEKYGIVAKAALAEKALPNCNIVFQSGDEMKTNLSAFLRVLYEANPSSVGGAMPDDAFYYGS